MVKVNQQQSQEVGLALKQFKISESFLKRDFLSFDTDRETKLRLYLLSTAICHQTHNLYHPEKKLWGWDYMEYAFLQMLQKRIPLLNPAYVCICNEEDISSILKEAFSPDGNPENTSLDRIEERANILIEICQAVKADYRSKVSDLIDQSSGYLLKDGSGLYETLARFTAFSDPQKKKITFFLKLAADAGILNIRDPQNILPVMDYHMQRVLLRTGCVEITDESLRRKLTQKVVLPSDEPVRSACIEAMTIVANASGYGIMAMNDFFWPLGRSCCNRSVLCQHGNCEKSPCTLAGVIGIDLHETCILENVCKGKTLASIRELYEPIVETHFY